MSEFKRAAGRFQIQSEVQAAGNKCQDVKDSEAAIKVHTGTPNCITVAVDGQVTKF